ncbi:hypothetical protein Pcac1_g21983 [Phytophthora cactorum]|uniref:Uncharacterized protein n=1 Tax=Phytophthora cactorum TaxID=29920 RepID=A0A8T1CPS6_9STRA|nr:hypothetical protein Pcac1_g21983 [Phytophthora cactorum]KAG2895146.1 hypothetical protein PC114_g15592 [Phytophthora cactorum]KAG2925927.1 hypothetical protein PC117_g15051 [Phytophthora cactorum]KAG3014300.1 hypothetical protein PC119_g12204 [Phytophthora cactorum]KAG3025168.1 hypothetical protein PC120_g6631 [Phytophthora cactorum]
MTATSRRLTKVNVAQLLKTRTPVLTTVRHEEISQIASEASNKTVAVVTEASVKTLVVDVASTATTSAHSMSRVQSAVG